MILSQMLLAKVTHTRKNAHVWDGTGAAEPLRVIMSLMSQITVFGTVLSLKMACRCIFYSYCSFSYG